MIQRVPTQTKRHLAALDGLRFCAALMVLLGHYVGWSIGERGITFPYCINLFTDLAMTLFFVLSGFVIHYNYHASLAKAGGIYTFFVARFSRLYPLYAVLFFAEMIELIHFKNTYCFRSDIPWANLLTLPFQLTLTTTWIYQPVCGVALESQWNMVGGVAWSVSTELGFYLAYVFVLRHVFTPRKLWLGVGLGVISYLLFLCVHLFVWHHFDALVAFGQKAYGLIIPSMWYNDSFPGYIIYLCPWVRIAEFICGVVAANLFMGRNTDAVSMKVWMQWGVSLALMLALGMGCDVISQMLTPRHLPLLCPVIAAIVYVSVACPKSLFSLLSHPWLVMGGEASYSIYLLNAYFSRTPRRFYHSGLDPWTLLWLSVLCILILSRLSYVYFERPVRNGLRKKMIGNNDQ